MITKTLIKLFTRDLYKLKIEIESYRNERNLWLVEKGITNSAGNLCLHLVGNLNAFIGAQLGNTNYIRQRDLEFSNKNVPRSELLKMVDDTIAVIENTLGKLKEQDLEKEYPLLVFKEKTTTEYFLMHLVTHLTYHLGQINYHRRLLS